MLELKDVTFLGGIPTTSQHPLLVAELAGGKIISDLRLACTSDDVVIGGIQALFGCDNPETHYAARRSRFGPAKYWRGTALLLGTSNCGNYFHWLIESLPRWKLLMAAGYADYDYVLLHGRPNQFQEETLDQLGVPAAKRLRCGKHRIHQFDRLIVPAMPFPEWQIAPWSCAWLRELYPPPPAGSEKIYVSRRDTARRRLVNEVELIARLVQKGFTVAYPEQMTFTEQVHLFRTARCVVGPHGAGLTNLIFAPANAILIELFHPQYRRPCYENLAKACRQHYRSLDGLPVGAAETGTMDCQIDLDAVLKLILKVT